MYRGTSDPIGNFGSSLLLLIMVPVYIGPVLAGLVRHPLAVLPVFLALFLLHDTARRRPHLNEAVGWAGLVLAAIIEAAKIGALFALGWGLSLLLPAITLPLWLPIALVALGVAASAWRFSDRREMDVFLASTLEKLADLGAQDGPLWEDEALSPAAKTALQDALEDLTALPKDAGIGEIDPIVHRLAERAGAEVFDALFEAAGTQVSGADRRIDLALLRYVSLPQVARPLRARGDLGLAPMLMMTVRDAEVRALAQDMLNSLIEDDLPAEQLPHATWLLGLERTYPGEGFATLATRLPTR